MYHHYFIYILIVSYSALLDLKLFLVIYLALSGVLDIDRVVRERDFSTIDENVNNVIDYCLEGEYDVKILDPNFVKLFRLAQLSVEYLLYCKQYLDHSVMILKDELRQKIEQNVSMKKEIIALEDTIKSLRERSKEKHKLIETSIGEIPSGEIHKVKRNDDT